jgi:hypothetical protein
MRRRYTQPPVSLHRIAWNEAANRGGRAGRPAGGDCPAPRLPGHAWVDTAGYHVAQLCAPLSSGRVGLSSFQRLVFPLAARENFCGWVARHITMTLFGSTGF